MHSKSILFGLLLSVFLGSCASMELKTQLKTPTPLVEGLHYGSYEEALKRTAHLGPQKSTWAGSRWLKYAVPHKSETHPASISLAWPVIPVVMMYGTPTPNYFLEFTWKGTTIGGKLKRQIEKLGISLEKPLGMIAGGSCPLQGLAVTAKTGKIFKTATVVIHGGNIVAVFNQLPAQCLALSFAKLDRIIEVAVKNADLAYLNKIDTWLSPIYFTAEGREWRRTMSRALSLASLPQKGALPNADQVFALERKAIQAHTHGTFDSEYYRLLFQLALYQEARGASPEIALLLKDLAWKSRHGIPETRRETFRKVKTHFLTPNALLDALRKIRNHTKKPVSFHLERRLDWYVDDLLYSPLPAGSFKERGKALLALQAQSSSSLAGSMEKVRARVLFARTIQEQAKKAGHRYHFVMLQSIGLLKASQSHVRREMIEDTMALLRLYQHKQLTTPQRLSQLTLRLFSPFKVSYDPGIEKLLQAKARELQKRAMLGTALWYLYLAEAAKRNRLVYRRRGSYWSHDKKLKEPEVKILARRLAQQLVPRIHRKNPLYGMLSRLYYKPHGPPDPFLISNRLNEKIPLMARVRISLGAEYITSTVPAPVVRLVPSPITCNIKDRYKKGTRRKVVEVRTKYKSDARAMAREQLEKLNAAILKTQWTISSLSGQEVSVSRGGFVGGVKGTSTRYSPGGSARTVYDWQGYRRVSVTVNQHIRKRIGQLSVRLRMLLEQRAKLLANFPVDSTLTRVSYKKVIIPTYVQTWSGSCHRVILIEGAGLVLSRLQQKYVRIKYDRMISHKSREKAVARITSIMNNNLGREVTLSLFRQFMDLLIERRMAQLSKIHGWTISERENEHYLLRKWLTLPNSY
ncbi:hypothetical protein KKF84_09985 [Myxococcota bacterium]|nr:hypothetical protein [Myxococcota bacterium]MBU1535640.1 hypothetical protein [Myxococcota bacterium]